MRRSTLQRKDRSELNQIAAALGAKPPGRARKDEIIQLILDLTTGEGRAAQLANGEHASADDRGSESEPVEGQPRSEEDNAQANGDKQADAGARVSEEPRNLERVDDDTELGNRRKRRRSRDRDRDREDSWDGDPTTVSGRLDLRDEGYGFLRVDGFLPNRNDAYVPVKTIRQFGLRRGDQVSGTSRPANRAEKNPALLTLGSINDGPAEFKERPLFEELTPIHAVRRMTLEQPDNPEALTARLIDLVAPIGLGQRVLIKAPRRSGASELLAALIASVEANEPDIYVMGLFLDQRPEDITEIRRVVHNGELAATSFDQPPEDHVQTAEMTVERAKRLVEAGRDVVVVLDGITTLAHAYNATLSNAGRAFSGNVESGAVHMPKKLFGTGRNLSEGGSLTMIASINSEGADPMQAAVYGEFIGTANTEICLDRWAAQRGLFPAIDVVASVSRDAHRFLDADEVQSFRDIRRGLLEQAGDGPAAVVAALELALARLRSVATNAELLR